MEIKKTETGELSLNATPETFRIVFEDTHLGYVSDIKEITIVGTDEKSALETFKKDYDLKSVNPILVDNTKAENALTAAEVKRAYQMFAHSDNPLTQYLEVKRHIDGLKKKQ